MKAMRESPYLIPHAFRDTDFATPRARITEILGHFTEHYEVSVSGD